MPFTNEKRAHSYLRNVLFKLLLSLSLPTTFYLSVNRRLLVSNCVCILFILFYKPVFYVITFTNFPMNVYFLFFSLSPLLHPSKLLAKIYKMPLKPIFLSGRLVNLPRRAQEQSASSEDGIECILSDFDDDTGKCIESSKFRTNQLFLLRVAANFANC